ncbi:MAG: glutathione S-transferase [Alphaproteobacteria bacterium]|jgi:glutathione S-transferase|nr:glutathione S-transferase [Alphaproteobacteria bacterium]
MITLYRHELSGHAHRVALFLSLIGVPYEQVDVDLQAGDQKRPEFLAKNVFGQVPVIDDDGTVVADSLAILVYLALTYAEERWYPRDPAGAAAVQRWLSVAAGQINNGPAAARRALVFGTKVDLAQAQRTAVSLFETIDPYLAGRAWLVGDGPTIADIAAYTYIARAPEGDLSLEPYPHIRGWLARIEALPNFLPMAHAPQRSD